MTIDKLDATDGTVAAADGVSNRTAYQTVHDMAADESLSVSVVEAVASAKGVDPLDLREPLYETVDPDALDRLFALDSFGSPRTDGTVTMWLGGCRVEVESTGLIRVFDAGR